jgi:hypothetical protein
VHATVRKVTTGRSEIQMTVRTVVTAFISLAVAAPVTQVIMLEGNGEYVQTARMGDAGRGGAGADR